MDRDIYFNKKILCVAESPFQLMGAFCLLDEFREVCNKCDLLIYGRFANAKTMAEKATETNLFDNVIYSDPCYTDDSHLGIHYLVDMLLAENSHRLKYKNNFTGLNEDYELLLCSSATRLSLETKRFAVPHGRTIFFDDGAGSHSGNLFKYFACFDPSFSRLHVNESLVERAKVFLRRFALVVIGESGCFNAICVCLFRPTDEERARFELPVFEIRMTQRWEMVEKAFINDADIWHFKKAKYIYLTLPDYVSENALGIESDLIKSSADILGDDFAIKIHPSRKNFGIRREKIHILPDSSLWEALILKGIIDESKILIGACSTAQTNVKALTGMEPKLVMLHRLFRNNGLSDASFVDIERDTRKAYMQVNRISSPSSVGEYITLLKQLVFERQMD